jgi:hypothetical protein
MGSVLTRLVVALVRDGISARGTRCSLVVAALIVVCVVPRGQVASEVPDHAPQYGGLSFVPGTCEQGPEFCAITVPREWTTSEVDLIRAGLDEITSRAVGRRIAERAERNGFRTLRRFAHAAELDEYGRTEAKPLVVAQTHTDDSHSVRTIDLTDQFFERAFVRDHFSGEPGYLLTTEILAHELVHAMDFDQRYSGTAEFRRLARLGLPSLLQREAEEANVETEQLNASGRYEVGWQISRGFGVLRLRGRLPSVQALGSYREAFAEFGAHLVLDPTARRRLEPRLLLYLQGVLSAS